MRNIFRRYHSFECVSRETFAQLERERMKGLGTIVILLQKV